MDQLIKALDKAADAVPETHGDDEAHVTMSERPLQAIRALISDAKMKAEHLRDYPAG